MRRSGRFEEGGEGLKSLLQKVGSELTRLTQQY